MTKILNSNDKQTEIYNVCAECGISANVVTCLHKYGQRPNKLCFSVSTYHEAVCDYCKELKSVTEVRDFFYPDFNYLEKYKVHE